MGVSSYLEIYLTQFGWTMYDALWGLLVDTGLAYLPFIGMILRNIAEPIISQDAKSASSTSLRRIEMDAVIMFATLVLAIQPYMTVSYSNLSYTKACSPGGKAIGGKTGQTYDTTFTVATLGETNAQMPIWWYAVLAVTGGFNDAAIASIPCTADIRLMSVGIENARVKDPQLRRQVQSFTNDCYRHALAMYLDHNQQLPSNSPKDDVNWLGSQFFRSGTYKGTRASETVPGFTYDPNRDLEYDPNVYIPTDGKPTCEQWWSGDGHAKGIGLRQALADQIDSDFLTQFKQFVANTTGMTQTDVEDIAIKTLIKREETTLQQDFNDLNQYNDLTLGNIASGAGATLGTFMEAMKFYPMLYALKVAAPIIQAVVLMLIYALMPFYFWFSSYQPDKILFMSIVVFSVKFWTVLWAIAHWLDNNLIAALKPAWYQLHMSGSNTLVEMIINFVIGGLFVAMPLFWSGVLGWAGFGLSNVLGNLSNDLGSAPKSAGVASGEAAQAGIKTVIKKGK